MITIRFVLLILALFAFVTAAFGVSSRVNLVAAGLALLVLAMIVVG